MFFFSTTYHLFLLSSSSPLVMEDVFIFSQKQDARNLGNLLEPKKHIIAGVMEMEGKNKLIWITDHNLSDDEHQIDELLDFINESLSLFTEDFQEEWL